MDCRAGHRPHGRDGGRGLRHRVRQRGHARHAGVDRLRRRPVPSDQAVCETVTACACCWSRRASARTAASKRSCSPSRTPSGGTRGSRCASASSGSRTSPSSRRSSSIAGAAHVQFCDRASRELWSAIGWADVVHAQNASPDVAMMAALLRKPLALTIHDFLPPAPWARRLSWQATARAASARWYNSRAVWKTWEPNGDLPASARVPTVSRFELTSSTPAPGRGFLFVGRLVDSKGVDTLLDAYHRAGLDPVAWPLTIVGDGPMRAELEGACAARACRASVSSASSTTGEGPAAGVGEMARGAVARARRARPRRARSAARRRALHHHAAWRVAGSRRPRCHRLRAARRAGAGRGASTWRRRCRRATTSCGRTRTRDDLAGELVPMSFYPEAYLRLCERSEGPNGRS